MNKTSIITLAAALIITQANAQKPNIILIMAGKWHVGMHGEEKWPLQRGFEHYYGILAGACSYLKPEGGRGITRDNTHLPAPEGEYYTTDAFTENAIRMIKEQKDQKPFFLYVAHTAPHWPLHALPEDIANYKDTYKDGWEVIRANRYKRMVAMGIIDRTTYKLPENSSDKNWESGYLKS